ncbi:MULTISPECIES: RelA/SpoT family protein [Pseudomonas]|uniref:RelA/SpoT family protein n=1 Tax=Pseudomonas TaxID=286 RepID=UPI001639EF84|nr:MULTISPECIES: RelA/SpoT family protein [Pseudomonas]
MYNSTENRIARRLQETIESELAKLGLLFRVFSRAKTENSLKTKIERNPGKYSSDGKKIQDVFGVRVVLYFPDDQKIAIQALKEIFVFDEASSTIDNPSGNIFSATRCNLIFRLPTEDSESSLLLRSNALLDRTFEIQFRTILSEGWHEVEHDLRYKCQEDWGTHKDLDRALNGIFATLETSDWSMLKLFEEMAYRNYKSAEWTQMLRNKFRLRSNGEINKNITDALDRNPELGKAVYRINREKLLEKLSNKRISIPITPDNIIYICNYFFIKSNTITSLTPQPLIDIFSEA